MRICLLDSDTKLRQLIVNALDWTQCVVSLTQAVPVLNSIGTCDEYLMTRRNEAN